MATSKVMINGTVEIDLTADTVTADTLAEGVTAHNSAGEVVTGTAVLDNGGYEEALGFALGSSDLLSYSSAPLSRLPEGTTYIAKNCFLDCKTITISEIPAGVTTIEDAAFNGCTGITSITFKGTPTSIATCFYRATNITDIYVPWAEGAVSGAPWGATNATMHYDSAV